MKLGELSHGIGALLNVPDTGADDIQINHITHDSRKVQHGSIFVAIEGAQVDGHDYIACASQLGALCIVTQSPDKVPCSIPTLKVESARVAMAQLARKLNDFPDKKLKIIGLTGTNGKTTGTYLIQHLLLPLGKCGRTGTLSYYNGLGEEKASRTTPEASDAFRTLGEMVVNGCEYSAMEISSHGLVMNRVRGMEVTYAIFTNLTQDHLDFHETMDDYFSAKKSLFADHLIPGGVAIINWDDPWSHKLEIPDHARTLKVGKHEDADMKFTVEELSTNGSTFHVSFEGQEQVFHIPMLGIHNIYNFCTSMAVALLEGRTMKEIAGETRGLCSVPGRSEILDLDQDFGVMVDFAHTPDALKNVLVSCREITKGRLYVIFGAGGDRDHGKRAEMGQMADKYADIIMLTSDNPRSEDPEAIMDMVGEGIDREVGPTYLRQWDRAAAIKEVIQKAQTGDMILIAGKGHETSQQIGKTFHPFDDRLVASQCIQAKLGKGNG